MKNFYIFAKSNLVYTKLVCEMRVGWGASPSGFFCMIILDNGEVVFFMLNKISLLSFGANVVQSF